MLKDMPEAIMGGTQLTGAEYTALEQNDGVKREEISQFFIPNSNGAVSATKVMEGRGLKVTVTPTLSSKGAPLPVARVFKTFFEPN